MSDERSQEPAPSVFGNLPASRPGTRSPRRAPEAAADPPQEPESPHQRQATDPVPAEPDRAPPGAATDEPREEEPGGASAGLEDLAWAGVAVAAEAATLGVRLATRAVEALRGAPRP